MADQIEFEELALRNVDPSLGPTVPLTGTSKQVNDARKDTSQLRSLQKVCNFFCFNVVNSAIFSVHRYHLSTPLLYIPPEQITLCIRLSLSCRHFWRVVGHDIEGGFTYGCSSLPSLLRLH
jgi:hypothetical protein